MTVEFKYDHNGLRTQKKVTSGSEVTTTEYTLHGKLLTHLTKGEDEMHFFYDNESRPAMVDFNGTYYSYVHNLQGDIVGILDNAGNLVVEYAYDAWGKPVVVRTLTTAYEALAKLNPFRYRGYVFDEETGLYYLRSRYYCPAMFRFVNADTYIWGHVYYYTGNNPINSIDANGRLFSRIKETVDSVVNGVKSFIDSAIRYVKGVFKAARMGYNADISEGSISIDIGSVKDDLMECYDVLGIDMTSALITQIVSQRYIAETGKEFMFTDECMYFEIREHIYSYIYATGERDLSPNLLSQVYTFYLYAKYDASAEEITQAILSATSNVDLNERDLGDVLQSTFFRYRFNIRPSRVEDAQGYYSQAGEYAYYGDSFF